MQLVCSSALSHPHPSSPHALAVSSYALAFTGINLLLLLGMVASMVIVVCLVLASL